MASLVGNKYFLLWKWFALRTKEFPSSILNLPFCFLSRYFACKCIFTVNCCLIMIKNYSCNPGLPSMNPGENPGPKMSDSPGSRGRDSPGLSSLLLTQRFSYAPHCKKKLTREMYETFHGRFHCFPPLFTFHAVNCAFRRLKFKLRMNVNE